MKWLLRLLISVLLLSIVSCGDYEEVEKEIGYKGKARINPWLAAEKFAENYGYEVKSTIGWKDPQWDDAVWVMPAAVLSNKIYVQRMEQWLLQGGHLILVVEHTLPADDWRETWSAVPELEQPLKEMLERAHITLNEQGNASAGQITLQEESYQVSASSRTQIKAEDAPAVFVSKERGRGRLTVLTDGRILRNRWISDSQHAALFKALLEITEYEGKVGFMRGTGLSFWEMMTEHLWPLLLGLGVVIVLWLWRSFVRFGPVEPANAVPVLRGYDHHLEALGDFQWRLDKARSLLSPIRTQIIEQGQRMSVRAGKRDDDFFQFLADRADLPRERVFRALAEEAPADAAVLTRTTADLQKLLHILN